MTYFQMAVAYLIPGMLLFGALLVRWNEQIQKALRPELPIGARIFGCVAFILLWPMCALYVIRNLLNKVLPE